MKIKVSDYKFVEECLGKAAAQTVHIRESSSNTGIHFSFDDPNGDTYDVKVFEASINMEPDVSLKVKAKKFFAKFFGKRKDDK